MSSEYDSRLMIFRSMIFKSTIFRSMIFRSMIFRSMFFRSMIFRSMIFRSMIFGSTIDGLIKKMGGLDDSESGALDVGTKSSRSTVASEETDAGMMFGGDVDNTVISVGSLHRD